MVNARGISITVPFLMNLESLENVNNLFRNLVNVILEVSSIFFRINFKQ